MAGMETPDALAATRYRFPCVWRGGHASRCAENLGWNPERDSGLTLQHREAREVGAIYRASRLMASWPSILLPIGYNPFSGEHQPSVSVSERPLSRRLGAPPYGARAGRKNGVYLVLDAKITIANLGFLEYAFSQKHIRL